MSSTQMYLFSPTPFDRNLNGDLKIWFADDAFNADVFVETHWFDLGTLADNEGDEVQVMLQGLVSTADVILLDSDDEEVLYVRKLDTYVEPMTLGFNTCAGDPIAFLKAHGWVMDKESVKWFHAIHNVYVESPDAAVVMQQFINIKK